MTLSAPTMLNVLRAVGEETRLRIVALLQHGELTVSDLTDILGQSQPRISRHLKLLSEAGVLDKHREGTWAFFGLALSGPIGSLLADLLARTDEHDPVIAVDLDRLAVVRARRGAAAQEYFAAVAERWDSVRSLHADDDDVEAAILAAVGDEPYRSLLDLGTGTGRMLELLSRSDGVERAVGVDNSHSMLAVARHNLERAEIRRVDLRQGDIHSPPVERESFDLVVVHQVLHFLDDPADAIRQARSLLAPGGRLLMVDFAPHTLEFLRTSHAHRRLGFRSDIVTTWLDQLELDLTQERTIDPPGGAATPGQDSLTVSLWLARDRRPSHAIESTNAVQAVQKSS
jgi:ubiquinone/menaquinone biosynthesis C-methylase UbiE/DNA-binding transcriptional ArsR family regulator